MCGSGSPVCAETPTLNLLRGPTFSHLSNQNSEKWEGLVTNHKYTPSTYQLSRTLEWLRTDYYNQGFTYHTTLGTQNWRTRSRGRTRFHISYSTFEERKIYYFNDQVSMSLLFCFYLLIQQISYLLTLGCTFTNDKGKAFWHLFIIYYLSCAS